MDKPGENLGSPHVKVCLVTMLELLQGEMLKQEKYGKASKILHEWWKEATKDGNATENEAAGEIKIFKIRGPPKREDMMSEDEELMTEGKAKEKKKGHGC